MSDEKPNGADVNLELAGQKINLRNVKSLNTLATVATLIIVVLIAYALWEHKIDARASSVEQQNAFTDMARAIREGNCINSYPEAVRADKVELCKARSR